MFAHMRVYKEGEDRAGSHFTNRTSRCKELDATFRLFSPMNRFSRSFSIRPGPISEARRAMKKVMGHEPDRRNARENSVLVTLVPLWTKLELSHTHFQPPL